MEVRQGYKYTEEFGYIPEDWEVAPLKILGTFSKGKGGAKKNLTKKGHFIIRYGEIYTTYNNIVQEIKSATSEKEGKIITSKDVLFAGSGETKEEIGKCITLDNSLNNFRVFAGGDIVIFSCKEKVSNSYLVYLLNSYGRKQIDVLGQGDAVVHIYSNQLKEVIVSLPPIQEQEKIAQVLRDMDKLIESTERLLEKKRNLKIAAIQKLLTPQSHWEERTIGDFIYYEQPSKYIVTSPCYLDNGYIPVLTAGKTFVLGYTNELNNVVENLPVILFDDFTTDSRFIDFKFKIKSSATKLLYSQNETINLKFFFYYLVQNKVEITEHKRHWIGEYHKKEMLIPPIQEQQQIAQILSDMDEEIEALEKELEKYRMIKTGAMQELLTGKTRLV